jgi:tRNA dimethylallyltransferase
LKKKLITISGQTASGKTNLSIRLAQNLKCSIISCDSRQFYKEMSIGTAVPSKLELSKANHYFIHHKSVKDNYTVGDFQNDALKLIENLFKKDDFIILTGGSGMYMDAIVNGIDTFPKIKLGVRELLNEKYNSKGVLFLKNKLKELDPEYHDIVDVNNHRRLIRALEVCISTGKPYSSFLNKKNKKYDFESINFCIKVDRELLYKKINYRVDKMISDGLIKEAKTLLKFKDLNSLNTVGYKELFEHFKGNLTKSQAIEKIKQNTRRYAKRQMTWLKNKNLIWIENNIEIDEIKRFINSNNL